MFKCVPTNDNECMKYLACYLLVNGKIFAYKKAKLVNQVG